MNNEQFRRLLQDNDNKQKDTKRSPAGDGNATPSSSGVALGSRQRANIPMTPYVVHTY